MINPAALASRTPYPRPIYRLEIDGTDITTTLDGRLISLTLTDNRGFEADQLDLEIDDSDGLVDLPTRGASARVWIGWAATGLIYKGSYVIDEIEHAGAPDTLTVRARSADLRTGLTTQRDRSWHAVTVGQIVNTIAFENDLEAAIDGALVPKPIAHIDQTHESAVNLLSRLAAMFDATATVKDGRLVFMQAAGGRTVSGKPLPAVTIDRADGDRHRFSIADRQSYNGVRAQYHDIDAAVTGEVIWGDVEDSKERNAPPEKTTTEPATGQYKALAKTFKTRDAARRAARKEWLRMTKDKAAKAAYIGVKAKYNDSNIPMSGEVAYGQAEEDARLKSAASLAEKDKNRIAGVTPDKPADPVIDHSADNLKTLRHTYANKTNAQRAARTEWRRLQRGLATFSITLANGRPELFPDVPATVSGYKRSIDAADWIIARVVHNLNDGGYTTSVDLEIKATEVSD